MLAVKCASNITTWWLIMCFSCWTCRVTRFSYQSFKQWAACWKQQESLCFLKKAEKNLLTLWHFLVAVCFFLMAALERGWNFIELGRCTYLGQKVMCTLLFPEIPQRLLLCLHSPSTCVALWWYSPEVIQFSGLDHCPRTRLATRCLASCSAPRPYREEADPCSKEPGPPQEHRDPE